MFLDYLSVNYPSDFIKKADKYYNSMADKLLNKIIKSGHNVLAIQGVQGSGKTTLANYLTDYFTKEKKLKVVSFSLDDFYYPLEIRENMSKKIHPLLKTRGVPGTHDTERLLQVFSDIKQGNKTKIPKFDKSIDDVLPEDQWQIVNGEVDVIIFEGWCLGAKAQSEKELTLAVNSLEQEYDQYGVWRNYVNTQLANDYQSVFSLIDYWVILQAPSFQVVQAWRLQQEKSMLLNKTTNAAMMSEKQVLHFIQYFQRITENILNNPRNSADYIFYLDNERNIKQWEFKKI